MATTCMICNRVSSKPPYDGKVFRIVVQVLCGHCCSAGARGSQGGNVRASKDRTKRGIEVPSDVTLTWSVTSPPEWKWRVTTRNHSTSHANCPFWVDLTMISYEIILLVARVNRFFLQFSADLLWAVRAIVWLHKPARKQPKPYRPTQTYTQSLTHSHTHIYI